MKLLSWSMSKVEPEILFTCIHRLLVEWAKKKKIQINTNPKEHILPVFCFGLSGFFMLAGIGNSFTDVGNTVRQVIKLNVENCCTVQKK